MKKVLALSGIILLYPMLSFSSGPDSSKKNSKKKIHTKKALYELGIGAGGGNISDYPASDQSRIKSIYFPSFIYRGKILKNDNKGTRALFYESENTSIDLSFAASFPANSKQNKARENMQNLDWLAEMGPRINYTLYNKDGLIIELELPYRFVLSTDFSFTRERGQRISPQIDLVKNLTNKLQIKFSAKLNWANETLNDYFYQVNSSDVTEVRERYNAKEGYIGNNISTFLVYKGFQVFSIFGVQHSNYQGSANENGPLYRVHSNTSFFMAFNFFFFKSKKTI